MHPLLALLLAGLVWIAAPAAADDPDPAAAGAASGAPPPEGAISGDLSRLGDAEIDARIAFLENRFAEGEDYATYWQIGFTSAWGLGVVIGGLQAGLTDNPNTRADGIVTAAKAAFGVTRLLLEPQPGMRGAEPITALPGDTREERIEQLRAGEAQLKQIAKRADERYRWIPHLGNLATNLAGMGVLLGTSTPHRAIESTVVGIVMGEVMIWSAPWRGAEDVADYERSFDDGLPKEPAVSWQLAPTPNGAAILVRF